MLTNKLNLPAPLVEAASDRRELVPGRYSVTEIIKGTREIILTRRHRDEITEDASDRIWLIFGTAVHKILEQATETDTQIKEGFVKADVNGQTITGIFDLYDDSTGTVTDYKTASVWKVIYNEWDDYRTQTLLYCCILRWMGFDARRGEIVALLKDHSKTKAQREANYPPYPVYRIGWDFAPEELASGWELIRGKLAELRELENVPDDDLPVCTEDERWHKPGKYAVMKGGRKRAIKLYDDRAEADIHALEIGGYVEHRPGEDRKCEDYCPVKEFCSHWRALSAHKEG